MDMKEYLNCHRSFNPFATKEQQIAMEPLGEDPTPGFDMSACIDKMSKVDGVTNPGAMCQWMYQKGKKGFEEFFKK